MDLLWCPLILGKEDARGCRLQQIHFFNLEISCHHYRNNSSQPFQGQCSTYSTENTAVGDSK